MYGCYIYWAHPRDVYYANTQHQAVAIGFDDEIIYVELEKDLIEGSIPMHCIISEVAIAVFKESEEKGSENLY